LSGFDPTAGTVTYTPSSGFTGNDSFSYSATDPNGSAAQQTVAISVKRGGAGGGAPKLTGVRVTHKRFRVGKAPTAVSAAKHPAKAPVGTSFVFTLSAQARVQIAISQQAAGLRRGRACVKPTPKLRRGHARRCTRQVKMGTLIRANQPHGTDSVPFSGRIGRRPLSPGRYTAKLTADNAAGRSGPVTVSFTVVR
jgi:hypothetical protein